MRLSVTLTVLRASVRFLNEFVTFKRLTSRTNPRFVVRWKDRFPCLFEKTRSTEFDRHYVYHTAWAARVLRSTKPPQHVDISSSLHFCTIVSAFIPTRFYDYRPPCLELDDLTCEAANLTALAFDNETIWSLSCMHVAEHVGLGRYGDELDPEGDVKAMSELSRVLARGGSLLFVVPVGKPKIRFNAHRIYSFEQVMEGFPTLRLHEFSLIPDSSKVGGLIRNARPEVANAQDYGCGCFWFRKAE